jgi:hypothetical protein
MRRIAGGGALWRNPAIAQAAAVHGRDAATPLPGCAVEAKGVAVRKIGSGPAAGLTAEEGGQKQLANCVAIIHNACLHLI